MVRPDRPTVRIRALWAPLALWWLGAGCEDPLPDGSGCTFQLDCERACRFESPEDEEGECGPFISSGGQCLRVHEEDACEPGHYCTRGACKRLPQDGPAPPEDAAVPLDAFGDAGCGPEDGC